jgi:hypothetical protein
MPDRHDGATRPEYFLARLVTLPREWTSLHFTFEDADRQLRAVGEAWGVEFTPDGEPAFGYKEYEIEVQPVLGPEESGEAPKKPVYRPLSKKEYTTWEWLGERRDVPGGLSADEMADHFGITSDVAARRLAKITRRGLAHEVSPGRYRVGPKDA